MEFTVFERFGLRGFEALIPILLFVFPWVIHGIHYPMLLVQQIDHCPQLACDFTRHYLPQAQYALERSDQMNGGWFYPPLLAILLIPWTFLENPEIVWTLFNIGGVFLLARLASSKVSWLLTTSLCATSLPILHALKWGQVSIWIAVCLCMALFDKERTFSLDKKDRDSDKQLLFENNLTAWVLGVASAIKIYPLVFVILPLLKQRIRWVAHCIASTVVFGVIIPMLWLGQDILSYWYAIQRGQQIVVDMGLTAGGQSLAPALHRWFVSGEFIGGQWSSEPLIFSASSIKILVLFGVLVFMLIRLWRLRTRSIVALDSVVFLISIHLLLQPGWVHYFAWLPIVQVWCWIQCEEQPLVRTALLGLILFERLPLLLLDQSTYFAFSRAGWMTIVLAGMLVIVSFVKNGSLEE